MAARSRHRWMLDSAEPRFGEDGAYLGYVGSVIDISERKEAEDALQEREAVFRTLADNISQLAWMADETGYIYWYNQRWFDYTGTTLDEMKGNGWRKVHRPELVDAVEDKLLRQIHAGEAWEDTFPLRRADGQYRWFLSRAMPVRDERGRVVRWFGTNTDIEEQRRQAAELHEAVQARDVFLSVASHELKTPMTPLALRLGMLHHQIQSGAMTPDTALRDLEVALRQLKRLDVLVEGLLDVSRISQGRLSLRVEPVDFAAILRGVIEDLAPQGARAGSTLQVQLPDTLPGRSDRMRLGQVFTNLVSNAIKFGDSQPIDVQMERRGEQVLVTVVDRGIGIASEDLQRIFGRFERAVSSRHFGGLGLGLYVTRQIVEALGGEVSVTSDVGQQTAFRVALPVSSPQPAQPESGEGPLVDRPPFL